VCSRAPWTDRGRNAAVAAAGAAAVAPEVCTSRAPAEHFPARSRFYKMITLNIPRNQANKVSDVGVPLIISTVLIINQMSGLI
jgi:hypothetical protein